MTARRIFIVLVFAAIMCVPTFVDAQIKYTPLAPIPDLTDQPTFPQYVSALFRISVIIGAILAVLMLVIGGFQWMVSEAVGQKEAGRERIKNAILGLLILLASVLILNTINPRLTDISLVVQELKLPPKKNATKVPVPEKRPGERSDCGVNAGKPCEGDRVREANEIQEPDSRGRCPIGFDKVRNAATDRDICVYSDLANPQRGGSNDTFLETSPNGHALVVSSKDGTEQKVIFYPNKDECEGGQRFFGTQHDKKVVVECYKSSDAVAPY